MRQKVLTAVLCVMAFAAVAFVILSGNVARGEGTKVYVTASMLNGRSSPSKGAHREALFDKGDELTATGKWSRDHKWIEIEAGENGTVWCDIRYLTERWQAFTVTNYGKTAVKIRSKPVNGKVVGYLKHEKTAVIEQELLGWGRCAKGWIDLSYVIEIVE